MVMPYRWMSGLDIYGTKIADFVFSVSESLLGKLDGLQNFVYLKRKRRLGRFFSSILGSRTLR